jgi:hypothetical protein
MMTVNAGDISNITTAFAKLTKDLDKTVLFRLNNPTPPPPDKVYKPLPTIHVPTQDARGGVQYISKKCTMPCNFHPVKVNGQTKVSALIDTVPSQRSLYSQRLVTCQWP